METPMPVTRQSRLNLHQRRLEKLENILNQLKSADQRFFWLRLTTFFGGWALAVLTAFLLPGAAWVFVLLVSMALFVVVVLYHHKLDIKRKRFEQAVAWFSAQVARMQLDWMKLPQPVEILAGSEHAFAGDLNLLGARSLLHLVDTCTTSGGHARLRDWLLNPRLEAAVIRRRQAVIREMVALPGFRNRLMLASLPDPKSTDRTWEVEKINTWLNTGTPPASFVPTLIGLSLLAVVNVVLFVLAALQILPAYWQFSLVIYAGLYLLRYAEFKSLFQEAYTLGKVLAQFRTVLEFLESYPYPRGSQLGEICVRLRVEEKRPSRILRRVAWLISAASLQNNQILTLLVNVLVPWDLFFTYLLNRYKETIRGLLPGWLDTWYEVEALNALANFATLNPEYTYAEIIEPSLAPGESVLAAQGLGHPLIPIQVRVCNDFNLAQKGEVAIITGSNMSGKSTFLRTLGINTVLALAGAPVAAEVFRLQLLRLFTCIQVSDSLSDGFSYFYAEVHRLKQLLDALQINDQPGVLFLIDEIFRGTNNHERRIGSQAYVRALVQANGAGLISTHDLELSKLADENPMILNYNFRDDVVDGRMFFDYRLRPGPSPTTNALKIMALEGLPINPA